MRELEDLPWFPAFLRKHQMDYLKFIAAAFNIYHPALPYLKKNIHRHPEKGWTDLCSGTGGPIQSFDFNHPVLLTDLYPILYDKSSTGHISYYKYPVNVLTDAIPGDGLITLFNGFHHFNHEEKINILEKIRESKRPMLIIEILQPTTICLLKVLFTTTIGHWLMVPFMKPFSLKRIIFTYLIPVHTLTIMIDGIISVCKSKTAAYYNTLAEKCSTEQYTFRFKIIPSFSTKLFLLYGES